MGGSVKLLELLIVGTGEGCFVIANNDGAFFSIAHVRYTYDTIAFYTL